MPLDLDDPTAVALAIFSTFSARRIEAALYGGLALAAYGEARETRDADFAVAGLGGAAAAEALATIGVATRYGDPRPLPRGLRALQASVHS